MKAKTFKSLVFILTVFLAFIIVQPAFAWTQTGISNSSHWTEVSHEKWTSVSMEGEASFKYEKTVSNFSMWRFKIQLHGRAQVGDYWDYMWNFFDHIVTFYIGDYPDGDYIKIVIVRTETLELGFSATHGVTVDIYFGDKQETPYFTSFENGDKVYEITIWRNSTNLVGVGFSVFVDWSYDKAQSTVVYGDFATVDPSWFDSVLLVHEVYKGIGFGWCGGEIRNEQIDATGQVTHPDFPEPMTLVEQIADAVVRALQRAGHALLSLIPEPYKSFLINLGAYAVFMVDIIIALFSGLAQSANVLFANGAILYGLYLLGLMLMCLNDMTFQPLYDHFITMYNFVTGLMSKIIGFLSWIWNTIKFW